MLPVPLRRYERASTVLTSNKGFEEWDISSERLIKAAFSAISVV